MRSDMKWIIGDQRGSRVSGPRKGKRFSPAEFRKYDWDADDAPFVGGRVGHALEKSLIGQRSPRGRGYTTKPMERYLARQVGRRWDDVLSDMRAVLRHAQTAEAHWPHLWSSIVAIRGKIVDGAIMVENWCGSLVPLSGGPKFYVDPRTGRLHHNASIETPRMRKKRIEAAKTSDQSARLRVLSPLQQLHRFRDGNWWLVTLTEIDWLRDRMPAEDVVLKAGLSDLPRATLYGRDRVYASAKRPLSAKEIKRYGLTQ